VSVPNASFSRRAILISSSLRTILADLLIVILHLAEV
jgi:hypothetical protein